MLPGGNGPRHDKCHIEGGDKAGLSGAGTGHHAQLLQIAGQAVTASEVEELKRLVNAKYDKRILLYDQGVKQWDTNVSITMVVRGVK